MYSKIENLVLPPGYRPMGRKLGHGRDHWLCHSWGANDYIA